MRDRRVKRLPVVGPEGELMGIVSRADLLVVYDRPDADILTEVTSVMIGEFGLRLSDFDVTVSSGVVTLAGAVPQQETALELAARIRHIEGVVAVRDRLQDGQPID
jgi:osmotically-inducible protein OsmY